MTKSPTQIWQDDIDREFNDRFENPNFILKLDKHRKTIENFDALEEIKSFRHQEHKALIEHVLSLGPEDRATTVFGMLPVPIPENIGYNTANAEWREVLKKVLEELI